jgi:putative PIN family toxin of toxin-antitoxin system
MKKVVLDTNIIISGLTGPNGAPGKILNLALQKKFHLMISEHLLGELGRALKCE